MKKGFVSLRVFRKLNAFLAAAALSAGLLGHPGAAFGAAGGRLLELLTQEVGISLLRDTAAGRELAVRLIGRPVADVADIQDLHASLDRADSARVRAELERRFSQAEDEARVRLEKKPLNPAERARLVEELSERFLVTRADSGGTLEFVSEGIRPQAGYEAGRAAMADIFDSVIPVEAGSIEDRLPKDSKVYGRLVEIENRYFEERSVMHPDAIAQKLMQDRGVDHVLLEDVLGYIVDQRLQMADELRKLAAGYRAQQPLLANTLGQAAESIGLSPDSLGKFKVKMRDVGQQEYVMGQKYIDMPGYTGILRGEMGELKVAVRISGLADRGLRARDLGRFFGRGKVADLARARLRELADRYRFFRKEFDLLLDQGFEWAEIKNYDEVLGHHGMRYDKVVSQAQMSLNIKKILESDPQIRAALKAMGKKIRLRIYLTGGVRENVATELEGMGIQVFGPRYPVGAPARGVAPHEYDAPYEMEQDWIEDIGA
jgi:hypothetical protein